VLILWTNNIALTSTVQLSLHDCNAELEIKTSQGRLQVKKSRGVLCHKEELGQSWWCPELEE